MTERNQFTFYSSFFAAAQMIKNKQARCALYDAICEFALNGVEPDLSKLPDAVAVAFVTAKPNLEASRRKAESGKQGGSRPKANGSKAKQTASEKEDKKENKKENEIEIENEGKPHTLHLESDGTNFTRFWQAYPKQTRREEAWEAWKQLNPDRQTVDRIMIALEAWMKSDRWKHKDTGDYQFAPSAAAFLADPGHWEKPPILSTCSVWGCSGLSESDIDNIRRMMAEPVQKLDEDELAAIERMVHDGDV